MRAMQKKKLVRTLLALHIVLLEAIVFASITLLLLLPFAALITHIAHSIYYEKYLLLFVGILVSFIGMINGIIIWLGWM